MFECIVYVYKFLKNILSIASQEQHHNSLMHRRIATALLGTRSASPVGLDIISNHELLRSHH